MKTWKKVVLAILAVPIALLVFATWYALHFSMAPAKPSEVNGPEAKEHVLIATQGSRFKDAVVRGVVTRLKSRPAYVKTIDVASLRDVREADWDAIVVLHTWEMSKPPDSVRVFVERVEARDKLVVLATSGEGSQHLAGVDAVTSASAMARVPVCVDELVRRVERVLAVQPLRASR